MSAFRAGSDPPWGARGASVGVSIDGVGSSGGGRGSICSLGGGEGVDSPVASVHGDGDHGSAIVRGHLGLGGAIHGGVVLSVVLVIRGVGLCHGLVEGGHVTGDLDASQGGLGRDVEGAHAPCKEAHTLSPCN